MLFLPAQRRTGGSLLVFERASGWFLQAFQIRPAVLWNENWPLIEFFIIHHVPSKRKYKASKSQLKPVFENLEALRKIVFYLSLSGIHFWRRSCGPWIWIWGYYQRQLRRYVLGCSHLQWLHRCRHRRGCVTCHPSQRFRRKLCVSRIQRLHHI